MNFTELYTEASDIMSILKDMGMMRKYPSGFTLNKDTSIYEGHGVAIDKLFKKGTKVYFNPIIHMNRIKTGKELNVRDVDGKKLKNLYKDKFAVISTAGYETKPVGFINIKDLSI